MDATHLVKEVQKAFGVEIDSSTIRRIRREDGLVYRRLRTSPKLNDTEKCIRYIWCKVFDFFVNLFHAFALHKIQLLEQLE
jgi:hypothetical protein